MKNYIIRYGLIGGTTMIVLGLLNWFLIARPLGPNISRAVGYIGITLALLCIPMGIKYFRDKLNHGSVSFAQSLRIGVGITLVTSVVTALYSMIFFVIAGEGFKEWEKTDMTEVQLQQVAEMPAYMNSTPFRGLIMFVMVFLIGMVVNLISSLVLKGNKTPKVSGA